MHRPYLVQARVVTACINWHHRPCSKGRTPSAKMRDNDGFETGAKNSEATTGEGGGRKGEDEREGSSKVR
jgi:hypothetical protein